MSEQVPRGPEQERLHVSPERTPEAEKHPEKHQENGESATAATTENLSELRNEVRQEALSSKDVAIENQSENRDTSAQPLINRELKDHMFERTLVQVRKQLSPIKRGFSKAVHTKPVEAVSSVGEKTIARPAGLLGGGLFALLGSSIALFMARRYGYRYNYLIFILLFIGGYILASMLELISNLLKRQKHGRP